MKKLHCNGKVTFPSSLGTQSNVTKSPFNVIVDSVEIDG